MAFEQMERLIEELRDAQLVTTRMMDRHAREWNERLARLEEKVASHEDGIAEMRSPRASRFARMDRFIEGLECENGHGKES